MPGDADGGAICATQGFGGYNGAVALRAANADSLARYRPDPAVLAAYLERWPEIRRERERRELRARTPRHGAGAGRAAPLGVGRSAVDRARDGV